MVYACSRIHHRHPPAAVVIGIGSGIAFGTADNQCTSSGGEYDYGVYCTSNMTAFGMIVYILAYALVFAYWIWNWGYRQGTTGQSIGKSVMKFKVISEKTGQPIGFGLSIVRQIAHIVDGSICYIGYLFPLWDAKRQTLADKIMSTICVPLNPQPLPPGPGPLNAAAVASRSNAADRHRNALTPVSASPMTNWCTSDVPS